MISSPYLFDIKPFIKTDKRDYLLIVPPGHEISPKIMYFKLKAWEMIGDYPSLQSVAHITINHDFDVNAAIFEEKLSYYKRKVAYIDGFEVKVCGFGYFRHGNSYTIYAKVGIGNEVKNALSRLSQTFSKNFVKTPHITIVRAVPKEKFDILWLYFEHAKFECSFYADKISVLETPTRKYYDRPMRIKTEIKLNISNKMAH